MLHRYPDLLIERQPFLAMSTVSLKDCVGLGLARNVQEYIEQSHPDVAFHVEPETNADVLVGGREPWCGEDGEVAFQCGSARLEVQVVALTGARQIRMRSGPRRPSRKKITRCSYVPTRDRPSGRSP